jgi:non-specific serine/threonine protein kinase
VQDPRIGTTLAHYRVVESLGAGGMGVVYGARDTKLERDVALKLLPADLTADADRLKRFRREARLLAGLNHPNIATIYGLEEPAGEAPFLVLERVDGASLAAHLEDGPLPLGDALPIAHSVAGALEAAHERGIVHRDLKPGNVMLSASGAVKLLDFGVARWTPRPDALGGSADNASTVVDFTQTLHEQRVGTPAYMSPEQIRVGDEDARTDVFAFGCLLYEMITGSRAFHGANAAEEMAAVLYRDPDWTELPAPTPEPLSDLLRRCLEKDPDRRLKEIATAKAEIEALLQEVQAMAAPPADGASKRQNLPLSISSFVGRRREIAALNRVLDESRLVTLTGVGGCGKSRLMVRVAEGRLARHPDGAWFVDLAPIADPARVIEALAAALGLREAPGERLEATVTAHLRERRALVLVDNCEHLIASVAALAAALLRACPGLAILATSREPLHVEGERVAPVAPLSLPEAGAPVEAIGRSESVRLFVERAALVRPGFALSGESAPIVAEICRRVDGIPLAIELAAARARLLAVGEILSRLDQRFRLLTGGSRTGLSRHQTLHATIQWSHDLLSPEEQRLFRGLSVFAGGWGLDAAGAIAGTETAEFEVLDLLTALTEKSLVSAERTERGESRYRFLETVKQYALERLSEAGEAERLRDRHLRFVRGLVERAEPELIGPDQEAWFHRLESEGENILAAFDWCERTEGGHAFALPMAGALWRFWWYHGRFTQGQGVIRRALALDRDAAPTPERAQAFYAAAQMARELGQYDEARALFLDSLEVARVLGDPARVARAYNGLGNTAEYAGDYDAARSYHEQALALSRQIGNQRGVAIDLHNLGIVLGIQKRFEEAAPLYEEALAIFRAVGDVNGEQATVTNLATIATELGQFREACAYFSESFRLAEKLPSQTLSADSLESFADLAIRMGAADLAATILSTADAVREATGYTLSIENRGVVEALHAGARAALSAERYAELDAAGRAMSFEDAVRSVRDWLAAHASA